MNIVCALLSYIDIGCCYVRLRVCSFVFMWAHNGDWTGTDVSYVSEINRASLCERSKITTCDNKTGTSCSNSTIHIYIRHIYTYRETIALDVCLPVLSLLLIIDIMYINATIDAKWYGWWIRWWVLWDFLIYCRFNASFEWYRFSFRSDYISICCV